MVELAAYVDLCRRQVAILDHAIDRDDIADQLLIQDRQGRKRSGHRVWTRRDAAFFDAAAPELEKPAFRTQRVYSWCHDDQGVPKARLQYVEAYRELKKAGQLELFIDGLSRLSTAHAAYLDCVARFLAVEKWEWNYETVMKWHSDAVKELQQAIEESNG